MHETPAEGFAQSHHGKEIYSLHYDDGVKIVETMDEFVPIVKRVYLMAKEYWYEKET